MIERLAPIGEAEEGEILAPSGYVLTSSEGLERMNSWTRVTLLCGKPIDDHHFVTEE